MNSLFRTYYNACLLLCALLVSLPVSAVDVVAQHYAAANAPSIKSTCTSGYDLLSGNVANRKSLIQGSLPYVLNYNAPLRQNVTAAQNFTTPEHTNTGWSDNYQSYVQTRTIRTYSTTYNNYRTTPLGTTSGGVPVYSLSTYNPSYTNSAIDLITIRLPGETADSVFKEENGFFTRLYSADPIQDITVNSVQQLSWSSDLGEYQLSRSTGSLIVTKRGVQYTVSDASYSLGATQVNQTDVINIYIDNQGSFKSTRNSWTGYNVNLGFASNSAVYLSTDTSVSLNYRRISQIRSQGQLTNLTYDSKMNLTQVSDSLNNKLTFERTYNLANQTDAESRLVTKVTYSRGTEVSTQVATMGYQTFESHTPRTGDLLKLYTLSTASSTSSSDSKYQYTLVQNGAVPLTASRFGRTADDSYRYPVLSEERNALDQAQQRWEVTQNYVVSSGSYSSAITTLRSYGVSGNATNNFADTTTIYDDIARTIQLSRYPDSAQLATTTVATTINNDNDVSLTITGSPCLFSGQTPVSNMRILTSRSQLQQITDAKGIISKIGYDSANRVISIEQASGLPEARTTTYAYGNLSNDAVNPYNIPTKITTPYQTITNVINEIGQINQQTQTSTQAGSYAKTTTYAYYTNGLLSAVNGPLADDVDKTSYTYDAYGNKSSESQLFNGVNKIKQYLGYNIFGLPERIIYSTGLVEQFFYNNDGTLQKKIYGKGSATSNVVGQTTTYTYDSLKQVKTETSPDGEGFAYNYDQLGRVIKIYLPSGGYTEKFYYPNGVLSSEETRSSSGSLVLAKRQYIDVNGRVSKTQSGINNDWFWVSYLYDSNGNKIQSTSRLGTTEKLGYDALNRVISHTDGQGNIDTKFYDLLDNVTSAKDAINSGSNPIEYINGNVLKKETSADFDTKTYGYDAADRIIQTIHTQRECNRINIDALGRPSNEWCFHRSSAANSTLVHDYEYIYDSTGFNRLEAANSIKNSFGTDTSYIYDAYNRITSKTQNVRAITEWGGTQPNRKVSYGYSTGGKLTSMTLPSGRVINYNYDLSTYKRGQMLSVSLNSTPIISSINYDGAGQTSSWTWANGSNYKVFYDPAQNGMIKAIVNTNPSNVENYKADYGFDQDGRILSITGLTTKDSYTYDKVDHLLTENRTNLSSNAAIFGITYTYDKNGNRLSLAATGTHQQPAANVSYTYKANSNRLEKITRNGVVTNPQTLVEGDLLLDFAGIYDAAGQRRWSGRRNGDATLPDDYMAYNHKRERTVRSTRNNGASWSANAIQYVYDEASHLIGEYKSDGTPIVEYVWKGDVPVAAIYGTTSATKIYYIITDALNAPRRLVDSSNNAIVWAWDSTAFGVAPPSVQTVKFNLRFPGQYYDETTKQHYNLNRYYNPEIGRYMEADPIGLEGGLNPYVYAGNSPIMISDQSGLCPIMVNGLCLTGDFDVSKPETYNHLSDSYTPAPTSPNHPKGYTDYGNNLVSSSIGSPGVLSDNALGNIDAQGTRQTGINAGLTLGLVLGGGGSLSAGIASDDFGNFSLYASGNLSAASGVGWSLGVSNSISNATYVSDLSGLGYGASIGGGLGPYGSIDYFTGNTDNGTIFGGGATIGIGAGLGATMGVGKTYVSPSINISPITNFLFNGSWRK
jgi:RHS repeat-associated protein